MKIVLISDTHTKHHMLELPEGDMIIHAGDVSNGGTLHEIYDFINWFAGLPFKYKVFIAGNHDFSFEDGGRKNKIREALAHHIEVIYLEDEEITIEDIKIYGSPWSPRFHDWAFNADRGEVIADKWALIPEDADIVVVHGPPYGYGDMTTGRERVGCEDLLERLLEVKPKLCIFGHIHEGYGMYTIRVPSKEKYGFGDQITAINASVVDSHLFLMNDPVLIDYNDFV